MLLTKAEEIQEFRNSGELSDICVVVDKIEFHLHKFPLFSNSEFFRALCRCRMIDERKVTLSQFPGGAKTFSLIADYCYGLQLHINSSNVVELRCAAEFLQMTSHGNLASEASTALTRILRSQPTSETHILDIISSACHLGEIANQTNILSLCFNTLIEVLKKGHFSENITKVLMELPIEWFVGFLVKARDACVAVPKIARLAGKYLERMVQQYDTITVANFGEMIDAILVELPENISLSKVIDSELLCSLFTLAVKLKCKCEGMLLTSISNSLSEIPSKILVTMPTSTVVSITEHSLHSNIVSPTMLCNTVDRYLWGRTKQKHITLDEFEAVVRAVPKAYRPQHDSILLMAEELFSTTKISDETKLKTLDIIDAYRLHEETLRQVSERNIIPSSFIVNSALAVSSRLRNELTETKAKLAEKDKAIREVHAGVSDVINGQWQYNDITLNVTPKDASNTRVQFAKVLSRNTSTELSMEHEVYDGQLTLGVQSTHGTSTKTLLFDPFNEQLIEITRSKHDNVMVGETYEKKKQATPYWPFTDVVSS